MIDRFFKGNKGHRWTQDEIKTLVRLWQQDKAVEEIAEALESTKPAISKMVVRLRQEGVPLKRRTRGQRSGRRNKPWSQAEIEYLLRRRINRATAEEIGDELGRSWEAINGMIQKLRQEGVKVPEYGTGRHRKWNPTLAMVALADMENEA